MAGAQEMLVRSLVAMAEELLNERKKNGETFDKLLKLAHAQHLEEEATTGGGLAATSLADWHDGKQWHTTLGGYRHYLTMVDNKAEMPDELKKLNAEVEKMAAELGV
jgi:hypothetical protein